MVMAKTRIVGPFATGSDVAAFHNISTARRQWLDREIGEATRAATKKKRTEQRRSSRTARLGAKKR